MNKTKMILAATGGAIGLAVLVMAYFAWSAYSAKVAALEGDDENGEEGLETVKAAAASLSSVSGGKIYPCLASVRAVESNTAAVVAWRDEANKLAARGDRPVKVTTPPQFKSDMVEEAKRIATLPGAANGKLVKPEFAFGPFKPYVAEGQMPSEAKLAELTRQWDDVVTVIDLLAGGGVTEILDVQLKTEADEQANEETADKRKRNRRPVRATAKPKEDEADAKSPAAHSYVFTFTTRAPGLIKAINALTTGERFIVIDKMTFVREKDVIAEALGDEGKKEEARAGGRRGRRRARAAEEKQEGKDEAKGGIVTDPLLDAPLKVDLTVTVYDFRSLEEEKTEVKGEAK